MWIRCQENAHFAISEALIAAIEHMKWNQVLRPVAPASADPSGAEDSDVESDEEILRLKQKINVSTRVLLTLLIFVYVYVCNMYRCMFM